MSKNTISSDDMIVQELAKSGISLEVVDNELRFVPSFIKVDHITLNKKRIGMWIGDPAIKGDGEDNIFWRDELEVFAHVDGKKVPIYFSNPAHMTTINDESIYPDAR